MVTLNEYLISKKNIHKVSNKEINGITIGDILFAVFQYSARFVDFYEVIDIKGKSTLIVKHLKKKWYKDDGYGQNGEVVPVLGEYSSDKEIPVRITSRGMKIDSSRDYAYKWSGKPEMEYGY